MNEEEFYLTLLSNSSMDYFPENKTTHFCTQLPKSVHLEGEWQVALTEVQYPCSILSVAPGQNIIYYEMHQEVIDNSKPYSPGYDLWFKAHLETGDFDTIEELITAINLIPELKEKVLFEMLKPSRKVKVTFLDDNLTAVRMSQHLSLQLGFEPLTNLEKTTVSMHPSNILLGMPNQFFIYCDIIEPQIVGDTFCKVLRVVNIDFSKYKFGSQHSKIFAPPHYVPVIIREFENIEIDIRSNTGENIPFQFGTVCVKLHFKKHQ